MAAISARLRAPDGCPWDRRQTHLTPAAVPAGGGVRDDRRDRARRARRPRGGARRPPAPGDPPRPVRRRGGRVRPDRRVPVDRRQDRPPPSARVRRARRGRRARGPRQLGDDQGRRAGRAGQGRGGCVRRRGPRAARTAGQPRDPGAGLVARLGLGCHRGRLGQGRRGARGAASGGHATRTGCTRSATCSSRSSTCRAGSKLDPEEALRTANHRWVARYRRVEALAAERGIDLAALSLAEKDLLWDEVKAG